MILRSVYLCVLLAGWAAGQTTGDFYVARKGNDSGPGTLAAPFATIARAQSAVRALKANDPGRTTPITVFIRGGTYYLTAPLNFTANDSGTPTMPVVYAAYPGEQPVISGGAVVTGWTEVQPGVWTATLSASVANFEQLFVQGNRRYRPRTTKTGYLYNAGPVYVSAQEPNCSVPVAGKGYVCFDRFYFRPGDLEPSYYDITGVEIDDFEKWNMSKLRLKSVDPASHVAYLTGTTSRDNRGNHGWLAGHRYLMENVKEALSQPGEWYLDRLASPRVLTYVSKPGEDLSVATVVAPQLPQILVGAGLQYVTFRGLSFEHDNWVVPSAGHPSTQGEPLPSAALSFTASRSVVFDGCTVAHTAGWGIEFIGAAQGSAPQGNQIVNSMFYDIGVGGIRIGHTTQFTDTADNVAQNNRVENNVVAGGGRFVADGVGIWVGNSHDNTVTHNDVFDWYHSGIELCVPTPAGCALAHHNEISFNHVWQVGQGLTSDLAGIYIATYNNPGNRVIGNRIHDVTHNYQDSSGYGGQGIYFDNETSGALAENNLVYRTSQAGYFNNLGVNNTVTNNILAYPFQGAVQRGQTMLDGTSFQFTHNAVSFRTAPQRQSNWTCTSLAGGVIPCWNAFQFDYNLYWNPTGAPPTFLVSKPGAPNQFNSLSLAQWQAQGEDTHSIVADPLFQNATWPADDFRIQAGSPALGVIQPFDPAQAGRSAPKLYPPALDPAWTMQLLDPVKDYGQPASETAPLANVNAASYATGPVAPNSIVAAFGRQVDGPMVTVLDSAGITRTVPVLYSLPTQLSFVMPDMPPGPAQITVIGSSGTVSSGTVTVAPIAPGLFSAGATGVGKAAANVLYYHENGTVDVDPTAAAPIDLSSASDRVFLVLYGTGIRARNGLAAVKVLVNGVALSPLYAGAQLGQAGLDQINVELPRTLAGAGTVNVVVSVDGIETNAVTVNIR